MVQLNAVYDVLNTQSGRKLPCNTKYNIKTHYLITFLVGAMMHDYPWKSHKDRYYRETTWLYLSLYHHFRSLV